MKYPQDDIKPYDSNGDKREQIEKMFDNIAPAYDGMNHTMTMGIDRMWRRKAIRLLSGRSISSVLDVASGTGDFAIDAYRMLHPERILCVDISEGMMEIGRRKVAAMGLSDKIVFEKQDCTALAIDDCTFDLVTVAFGIRNFTDLGKGLSEMYRVLKPGGCVMILELSRPEHFPMKQLYDIHARYIIPVLGSIQSKDKSAYEYLPESIAAFPASREVCRLMESIGYKDVSYKKLTFGVCTMYFGNK